MSYFPPHANVKCAYLKTGLGNLFLFCWSASYMRLYEKVFSTLTMTTLMILEHRQKKKINSLPVQLP